MQNPKDTGSNLEDGAMRLYEGSIKSRKFSGAVGMMAVAWAGATGVAALMGVAPILELALAAAAGVNVVGASLGYAWSRKSATNARELLEQAVGAAGPTALSQRIGRSKGDLLAINQALRHIADMPNARDPEIPATQYNGVQAAPPTLGQGHVVSAEAAGGALDGFGHSAVEKTFELSDADKQAQKAAHAEEMAEYFKDWKEEEEPKSTMGTKVHPRSPQDVFSSPAEKAAKDLAEKARKRTEQADSAVPERTRPTPTAPLTGSGAPKRGRLRG